MTPERPRDVERAHASLSATSVHLHVDQQCSNGLRVGGRRYVSLNIDASYLREALSE